MDELTPRARRRRYPFWARRDRRHAAQALGAGRAPAAVAAAQRVSLREIEQLLRDREFQVLVAHYRELAALPEEVRLDRLAGLALELLERAIDCGDMRVAMFVLYEQGRGRNAARSLAAHVVAMAASEPSPPSPLRHKSPPPPANRPADEWSHCAATKETADDAEALALARLRGLRAAHRRTLKALSGRLTAEAERWATSGEQAAAMELEQLSRGVARHYHDRPTQSMQSAIRLDRDRRLAQSAAAPSIARSARPPP
ncbi:hypothetical protein [Arboricoccus pini]|nr:hypothetical protein [Arboricoccus pini]